jgi:eukaryotic-like serine/threonine-protein kinase
MADLVGQTIGNYKIEALLGTGGMGQVYRGTHSFLKVERALKVMNPGVAADPTFQARFQQEAQAAAALSHQNIVEVFDFGEQDDQYYMVMELVTNGSLRTLLRQRASGQTWELPLGIDLIRQAAEGLGYAHQKGMVHRDIKPDNLLLRKLADAPTSGKAQYLLKITDFGLARLVEGGGVRTVSGVVMGTPAYMSPEQCQGGAVDGRSDLYSLGVVLYEVATGYLPFQAATVSEAIYKHVFVAPPPPRQVRPDLPQALEDIILRCLAKKPEGRFNTGEELSRVLQGVMGVPELTTMAPIRPNQPKPSPTPATPPAAATALEAPNAGASPPPAVPPLGGSSAYPRIRVIDPGGRALQVVEVNKPVLTVGRQPGSDILLADEGVSRQHLRVTQEGARVLVTDLGSNNGTILAGSRLLPQATAEWQRGQSLRVGPFWLMLEAPTTAAAAGPSQLSGAVGAAPAAMPAGFHAAPTIPGSGAAPNPYVGQAAPITPPARESGRIKVTVEQDALTLTPGQPATIKVTIANTGTTVDHLSLVAEGVPTSWVQGPGREVQLNPGQQETTSLTIQAPRQPNSRAGMYPVTLRANSRENPGDSGSTPARWTLAPFTADTLALRPTRVRARRTARYGMMVQNNGNAPVQYSFSGEDPEEKLQYLFARATINVDPGMSLPVPVTIRAPWKLSGQPETRDFRLSARPGNGGPPQVAAGQLVHASLLPGWLPPPLLALLVAGVLLLASIALFAPGVLPGAPSPTATVPVSGNGQPTATPAATATLAPTPTQPVQANGSTTIAQNSCFDLDNGTTVDGSSTEADVCWQIADPSRFLMPKNTAQIALQSGSTAPGFQDCLNAALRSDPIDGSTTSNEIPSGAYLCLRTSGGRAAMMHITMYGTDLTVDYTTWKS